jgi:uncharacterized protein
MRRKDREITDFQDILHLLSTMKVIRLGLLDKDIPYIVPLNFGYKEENEKLTFYFHSALKGRKIDLLKIHPKVCFEMDTEHQLIEGKIACDSTFDFASIMGLGIISFIEDPKLKVEALNHLMRHQSNLKSFEYDPLELKQVSVYQLEVSEISAKRHLTKRP